MKKITALLLSAFLLLGGALAEQEVILPDGAHSLMLPEGMSALPRDPGMKELYAVFGEEGLEMEIFVYPGNGADLTENAQTLVSGGKEAEVREIRGVELLVYRDTDEADGAKCIGYMYPAGDSFVEICFWYGTNEAGLKIRSMMETFQELE